jgi:translation initiation factor IF-1
MRDAFQVEGRVIAVLPNGTVRAELKNGHRLLAFVLARDKKKFTGVKTGDEVRLQLTPFDLSAGRILLK